MHINIKIDCLCKETNNNEQITTTKTTYNINQHTKW